MNSDILLSLAYLGSVQYFSKIIYADRVFIEQHENYNKKTFRNRCDIYSANGKEILSIPVKRSSSPKCPIKDVLIDYDTNWQKSHWKSLESSYRSSPFYEYYIDDLEKFYTQEFKYLWDYNFEILNLILSSIDIKKEIHLTEKYEEYPADKLDHRGLILPKNQSKEQSFPIYKQVFDDKHGFIPNLSIIDLIFNEGPNTTELLKNKAI